MHDATLSRRWSPRTRSDCGRRLPLPTCARGRGRWDPCTVSRIWGKGEANRDSEEKSLLGSMVSSGSEMVDGRESDSVVRVTGAVIRIFIDAEEA